MQLLLGDLRDLNSLSFKVQQDKRSRVKGHLTVLFSIVVRGKDRVNGDVTQDLNTCTARTTYCRQMGHSLMRLPHFVHVTMCPHSNRTQSMGESIQILHRLSSTSVPVPESVKRKEKKENFFFFCGIFNMIFPFLKLEH